MVCTFVKSTNSASSKNMLEKTYVNPSQKLFYMIKSLI